MSGNLPRARCKGELSVSGKRYLSFWRKTFDTVLGGK